MGSLKGDLLDALSAYAKALQGTPGESDLAAACSDLSTQVSGKPDPQPAGMVPPSVGQSGVSRLGTPSSNTAPGWPSKGEVVIRISGS